VSLAKPGDPVGYVVLYMYFLSVLFQLSLIGLSFSIVYHGHPVVAAHYGVHLRQEGYETQDFFHL
jgi:hypothetical protein